jgi:DNA primase
VGADVGLIGRTSDCTTSLCPPAIPRKEGGNALLDLETIRAHNPIEAVVGETFKLKKVGAHFTSLEHGSLVVNPRTGWYHWNSKDERGDVFDFVGRHVLKLDWSPHNPSLFLEAIRYLAQRAGLSLPEAKDLKASPRWAERQLVARLQEALLKTPVALAYAQAQRGWDSATLGAEKLGYMPRDKRALLEGLPALPEQWRTAMQRFPAEMLVYVHLEQGRLRYLSGRSLTEKRHYNPPGEVVGERQPYFNHLYTPQAEEVVLVEGQADAITCGLWGFPAIAMCGMKADTALLEQLASHRRIEVLLDNTPEAQAQALELARAIGLRACLPTLPDEIKDANAWWVKARPTPEQVAAHFNTAPTLMEKEVDLIRQQQGRAKQDAVLRLIEQAASWDKADVAQLKQLMKERLHISMTLFNDLLKACQEKLTPAVAVASQEGSQLLGDEVPLIAPALGFLPELAVVTVALLERTSTNRLQLQPYLVTSQRELVRLEEAQVITIAGQEIALRVLPEGTEFLRRWRYSDIQRFLAGESAAPRAVFEHVHGLFTRHVDFASPSDSQLVALWVIGTYFYTLFGAYPYLALNGPKNSGKSTLLTVAKPLAFNMLTTSDVTGPSLFRIIHHNACTVGIDEAERYHNPRDPEMQQIRQLLNSGYKPGMPAIRLMGEEMKPQAFDVYAPKILANIAGLEDILASRCIPIPMRRAEHKLPTFPPNYDGAGLRHRLYSLALTHFMTIRHNYENRPELHTLLNRSHELWSPLVALAAFFEEQGGAAGLLEAVQQAANRDQRLSDGKALSHQEEAVLQALELLTRTGESPTWIKGSTLREQVLGLLDLSADRLTGVQWIGHILKRLQLTDRTRSRHHAGGQMYAISREDVLEMMRRYDVPKVEISEG